MQGGNVLSHSALSAQEKVEKFVATTLANVSTDGARFIGRIFQEIGDTHDEKKFRNWLDIPSQAVGLSNKAFFVPRILAHCENAKSLQVLPNLLQFREKWIRKHSEVYADHCFEYMAIHVRGDNCITCDYPPEFYALIVARGILAQMPEEERLRNIHAVMSLWKKFSPDLTDSATQLVSFVLNSDHAATPADFLVRSFRYPYSPEVHGESDATDVYTRKQAQLFSTIIHYFAAPMYSEIANFEKFLYQRELFPYMHTQTLAKVFAESVQ